MEALQKVEIEAFILEYLHKNIIGMISHLAAMLPVATGFGLASKLKKDKKIILIIYWRWFNK